MAYSVTTDYQALKNQLQKQIDAETDAAKKAALQTQYNAAQQSRLEKIASNLTKYGKYADDSELDSAAGILAKNQVGTTYDTQRETLNKSYDTAKQNANNDALSRGMARSSYVSDRLSSLDSDLASDLSSVDSSEAAAIQSAKSSILSDYQANLASQTSDAQTDARNQISTIVNSGSGAVPSDALWTASGYDASTIAALKAAIAAGATGTTTTSSTKSSGSSSSSKSASTASATGVYDAMKAAGITTEAGAYAYALSEGYTSTEASKLAAYYADEYYTPATTTTGTTAKTAAAASKTPLKNFPTITNYGASQEVSQLKAQGYTAAQIKKAAAQQYATGSISLSDYLMYLRNAGS